MMPPNKFQLKVQEKMSFKDFQEGRHSCHLGYRNGTILAVLNPHVTVMPPIKFGLIRLTVGDPWRPSWISERNDFSNSESLCHCDTSHQVSAQSDLRFGRRSRLKNFKMAAPWISERNDFRNSESPCCHNASH